MTLKQVREKLKVFDKYNFVEDTHSYFVNGKRVGISTTGLIHQYSQEFDSETIAQRVANRNKSFFDKMYNDYIMYGFYNSDLTLEELLRIPKTKEAVLKEWRIENLHSTVKGNMIHLYAQSLWLKEQFDIFDFSNVSVEIDKERLYNELKAMKAQADNFYNDYSQDYELVDCELYLGVEDFDECGACDIILWHKTKHFVKVLDFKSNKKIEFESKYNKTMLVPLNHLDDCNFNHYSLQLSAYVFKIYYETGIICESPEIVYFDCNKENYQIIDPLDLKNEVKEILENRRIRNMKSIPVLMYGKSGSGKTSSFRNYNNDEIAYINILDKPLPFRSDIKINSLDSYDKIIAGIKATKKKTVVIDDAGFLLTNEMFERSKETGYAKFTQMAEKFYNLIKEIKKVEGGKIVVISMHEDNEEGQVKLKTAGKMIESNGVIEGNFTVAIRTMCDNGNYVFSVKNTGNDITKTPIGMFEENEIDNDFKVVDKAIREYYNLDEIKDEEKGEEE